MIGPVVSPLHDRTVTVSSWGRICAQVVSENDPPGPEASLYLRNVTVVEDSLANVGRSKKED